MMKGKFIVFEGIDCTGKTTQIELLKGSGVLGDNTMFVSSLPEDDSVAGQLRVMGLDSTNPVSPTTRSLLFLSALSYQIEKVILPALERGVNVVCDRYVYSNIAYQDVVFNEAVVDELLSLCTPDVVIYLNIDIDVYFDRLANRGQSIDVTETTDVNKVEKLLARYDQVLSKYSNVSRISSNSSRDVIHNEIKRLLVDI